jgi:hypothetical protein
MRAPRALLGQSSYSMKSCRRSLSELRHCHWKQGGPRSDAGGITSSISCTVQFFEFISIFQDNFASVAQIMTQRPDKSALHCDCRIIGVFVAMHLHFNLLFSNTFLDHAGAVPWLSLCYRIPMIPIWLSIFYHILIGYLGENALRWRMAPMKFGKGVAYVICWRFPYGHELSSRLLLISGFAIYCMLELWTTRLNSI